ncbi:MAG: M48 family metalloprotease [Gammaproteobacteria bacterium]|nr:M48 family metalloprotease [Gammaproteobacteria bacterium]
MRLPLLTCCIFTFALAAVGCAVNPVTGKNDLVTISEAEEVKQGASYHQQILEQYGVYDNAELQAYVNNIGQMLAKKSHRSQLKFYFTVLDSPQINAFALPGGYIYITRGIMAYLNSEAEIAGVLGHEIGHVTARHSVRQQSGQLASALLNVVVAATTGSESLAQLSSHLSTGIVRGYGRDHELEADELGAQYLHETGYNPESMLEVIGVLKDQEIYEKALAKKQNREANIYHGVYSTHPKNDSRLQTVVRAAKKLSSKDYRDANAAKYLKMIDGMTWGQNIKQGVVVNNRFMHPDLAIAIQFPSKWQITNSPDVLLARNHDTGAIAQLSMVTLKQKESLQALLKRQVKDKELVVKTYKFGASAITRVNIGDGSQPARISALKLNQKQAILFIGTSSKSSFSKNDTELLKINNSFTRLNAKQVAAIDSPILRVVKTDKGDSFKALAQQSPIDYDAESILRLLNRAFPTGKITPNQSLKIVGLDD